MNYLEYFGLQAEPFLNSSSSRVFYKSAVHGKAMLRLMTAADADSGVVLLVGETGVGKSLLLRRLLDGVSEEATRGALVSVPEGGLAPQLLVRALVRQLRLDSGITEFDELSPAITELVAESMNALVIIDDAHRLDADLLGELARLEGASLVFAGSADAQYPNGEKVKLTPLNSEATDGFIRQRLKLAGRVSEIFTQGARKKVFTLSGGYPARINTICEHALLCAGLAGTDKIDEDVVVTAAIIAGLSDAAGKPQQPHAAAPVTAIAPAVAAIDDDEGLVDAPTPPANEAEDDGGLDDVLSRLEDEDEPEEEAPQDDVGDMLAGLSEDDAGDDSSDDSSVESAAAGEDDDLDSILDDLTGSDAAPEAKAAPAADGDLDDLLDGLSDDEESADEEPADEGDDLDDMFDGLTEDEPAPPPPVKAKAAKPAPPPEDDLDSLLDGLDDEAKSEDDDLDSMLDGLGGDDPEPPPAPAPKPVKAKKAASPPPEPEDDLDSLLDGLDEDSAANEIAGEETIDDMLSGLQDEFAEEPSSGEDLDSLLADLDDNDAPDEPPPPPKKAAAPKAKTAPQTVPPAPSQAEDDLDDLLNSLDDDPAPKSDNLDDELDSLLEGLDD